MGALRRLDSVGESIKIEEDLRLTRSSCSFDQKTETLFSERHVSNMPLRDA